MPYTLLELRRAFRERPRPSPPSDGAHRGIAEGAPHPLVGEGLRVEHDHAAVAVAVGVEHLVGGRAHERLRRPHRADRVLVAAAPGAPANLQEQLACRRELQQHVVRLGPRAVAADPDVAGRVDVDAVLVRRPVVAVGRAAPGAHERPVRLERQHRRRRRPQVLLHRAGPVQHPDPIVRAHGHRRHLAEHPVVGDAGPGRVDLELRHAVLRLRRPDGRPVAETGQRTERDDEPDCRQPAGHSGHSFAHAPVPCLSPPAPHLAASARSGRAKTYIALDRPPPTGAARNCRPPTA